MAAIKLWVAATPAEIDAHVAADAPARLLKPLHECRETPLSFRIVCRKVHEHADAAHLLALLRARREGPRRCRPADNGDEIAPSHVFRCNYGAACPMACRALRVSWRGRQVLGQHLKCSESR